MKLLEMVKGRQVSAALEEISGGADVNALDEKSGESLLHIACSVHGAWEDSTRLAAALIAAGADVNYRTPNGRTALAQALNATFWNHRDNVTALNVSLVQLLLSSGANIDLPDETGRTPLLFAAALFEAKPNELDCLRMLARQSPDIDKRDHTGRSALTYAVRRREEEIVRVLLDNGANPNGDNGSGDSLLCVAAKLKVLRIAFLLLERGANVDSVDRRGETALELCEGSDGLDALAELLVRRGARVRPGLLHSFARWGKLEAVRAILDTGADPNATVHPGGWTTLHHAAECKNRDIAQLLLQGGAKPNVKNQRGQTPLHLAAAAHCHETAMELILAGANVNARDLDQRTPLHEAVGWDETKTAAVLLDNGADIEAKAVCPPSPKLWWTPLHEAVKWRCYPTCKFLLEKGADIDAISGFEHLRSEPGAKGVYLLLERYKEEAKKVRKS
jgi:cytohesin